MFFLGPGAHSECLPRRLGENGGELTSGCGNNGVMTRKHTDKGNVKFHINLSVSLIFLKPCSS